MKQVIINIPDNKYDFFLELVHNLGFEKAEDFEIPEEHKSIVRDRIKNSNPDNLIPWEEAREKLHFKKSNS